MANVVSDAVRTRTATIVAVAPSDRLAETRDTLRKLSHRAGVRPIVVTLGDTAQPPTLEEDGATIIEGLTPRYLNNLVAARRLSSLPAVAWWRGGDPDVLDDLAAIVDKLVLDSLDPAPEWRRAAPLLEATTVGDVRWTRLTRWRSMMAQFFDIPDVRAAAGTFNRLEISAGDTHAARLFAGWLRSALPNGESLDVSVTAGPEPVSSAALVGVEHRLELRLTPRATCVSTSIGGALHATGTRTVSLGDQSLAALLEQELRIRARDTAFEHALRFAAEAA